MFLTRKHLSRRTLLKGAGISLALPFLESMIPAATPLAQTAAAPRLRVGFFYLPHGAIMGNTTHGASLDRWTPTGSGATFKFNTIMQSLEPHKKYVTSIGDLKNDAVGTTQHVVNAATWLSATTPELPGPKMSATLDQVLAAELRSQTLLPSLEVSSERTGPQSGTNSMTYTTLSFRDATTPLPMEYNPRKVFLALVGRPDGAAESKETASLLDFINDQTRALQRDLPAGDRAVLDNYLTSIRDVEQREQQLQASRREVGNTQLPPLPEGVLDRFDQQVKLMFDLIAIAYQADLTRVVSFAMAAERTNQTYNHIGVPDSFHPVSHHANQLDKIERLVKIQTWHMECFAEFLGKLAAIREGEATLLDNAMFLYGSNMSNSDRHDTYPLPTLVVGGAAGKLSGGRHISLREPTSIANLHLSLLEKAGVERAGFGNSTGRISL